MTLKTMPFSFSRLLNGGCVRNSLLPMQGDEWRALYNEFTGIIKTTLSDTTQS